MHPRNCTYAYTLHNEATVIRETIKKKQETNTPIVVKICQFAPKFKLDPSR